MWLMGVVPVDGTKGETMKKLIATVILFGLGTGLALAKSGDNWLDILESVQQVRTGDYATQTGQNGEVRFIRR
jgi:hypothetical protein